MKSRSQLIFNILFSIMTPFVTIASFMPFIRIMGESSPDSKNKAIIFIVCYWVVFLVINVLSLLKNKAEKYTIKNFTMFLLINIVISFVSFKLIIN